MNNLETSVIELIGENPDSPDVFTESGIEEIRSHVNDALEEICILIGGYKHTWHVPLKSNCTMYRIPEERERFGWFDSVYLAGNKSLLEQIDFPMLDFINPRWQHSTGTPAYYAPFGYRDFAISPAPASSSDTLEIVGVALPKRYSSDTDRINLRPAWQHAAVNRAVSEWWATRGDAQTAARYFQVYAQALQMPSLYPEQAERRWQYRTKGTA